ncbi:hypothetical protein AAC387_Pa04g1954 [Persea americana]
MGVYRYLLEGVHAIAAFRVQYNIPANVEVRLDNPDDPSDGLVVNDGLMPFLACDRYRRGGGVQFSLHLLLRDCLWEWHLCPCQLIPNSFKIFMGVVQLNRILGISLGVSDIEDLYDLCKSGDGNSYYLLIRSGRASFVTALEDSYQFAGENRIFVKGEWEFGESKTSRSIWIPRRLGTPPRYVPRYRSFNTKRRVTEIDSVLPGEGTSVGQVMVAVPAERLIESGDRASASHPDSEPAETAVVEAGTSSQWRRAVVASSSEEEDRMLLRRR